jgi:hypothetical protein
MHRTARLALAAILIGFVAGCGSRATAAPHPFSVSQVKQAYRASGFHPEANLALKTPRSWLGDFYLGDPEPSAHITVFKTAADAKRATGSGLRRTVRRRNVVVTFLVANPSLQARVETILVRLAGRT